MMQNSETGAAGRNFGYRMAAHVISLMKLRRKNNKSNEVNWEGQQAVVKSCGRKTTSYSVTVGTLERVEVILAAFVMADRIEVWALKVGGFELGMYDSRSGSADGKMKQVSRSHTRKYGTKIIELPMLTEF